MQKTDEELMNLYQAGEISAFNELYSRYNSKLFGYLRKHLSAEESEEVYQDVFRKLHEYRHRFDSSYPFAPWLFTLTRRLLIDFYRKNRKVNFSELDESYYLNESSQENEIEIDLGSLSEENQKIISMRYFDGKEFNEMARELNLTEVNVRKKISRAIKKLKETWRT